MRLTVTFLAVLVCAAASEGAKPKPPPAPPPALVPDFTLTVEQYEKDYTDNEIAAEKMYHLKILQLTGKIKEIGRVPMSSSSVLTFETDGDFPILAHFLKENEDLVVKVKRGDTVTVIGYGAAITKEKQLYITRCSSLEKVDAIKP